MNAQRRTSPGSRPLIPEVRGIVKVTAWAGVALFAIGVIAAMVASGSEVVDTIVTASGVASWAGQGAFFLIMGAVIVAGCGTRVPDEQD